jgi:anti-anti-sigma factor
MAAVDYETPDLLVRETAGVTIATVRDANLTGMVELKRITAELDAIIGRGVRKLVLDVKDVVYAGSAALGLLMALRKKFEEVGGKLVISHAQTIGELLRVSHTTSLFKLAPDVDSALKSF